MEGTTTRQLMTCFTIQRRTNSSQDTTQIHKVLLRLLSGKGWCLFSGQPVGRPMLTNNKKHTARSETQKCGCASGRIYVFTYHDERPKVPPQNVGKEEKSRHGRRRVPGRPASGRPMVEVLGK